MAEVQFAVSWDAYQKSICNGLSSLQQRGEFVDMTIAADGHHVKVHQMILSLVSPYIKELITSAQCPHPVIFFNQVSYQTLQLILEYAYTGEVLVTRDRLGDFLDACKSLHIKGLEKTNSFAYSQNNFTEKKDSEIRTKTDATKEKTSSIQEDDNSTSFQTKFVESTITDDEHMDYECIDDDNNDDNDHDNSKEQNKAPLHAAAKENNPSSILQYTVSCQGSLQLVLNRYVYALSYTRKNSQRLWRCIHQRLKCPALVTTQGDRVVERSGAHNHPFHDDQIMKRVRNGNMFTVLSEAEHASDEKKRKKEEES